MENNNCEDKNCEICTSPYRRLIELLYYTPWAGLLEPLFEKDKIDFSRWFDGNVFGWQVTESKCKVCGSECRDLLEWLIRSDVSYNDIIQAVPCMGLNKPNISLHRSRHMNDDLVHIAIMPDLLKAPGLLVPRRWLLQRPHLAKDGQIFISKCSLIYCLCPWLEKQNNAALCSYTGKCPNKGGDLK